MSIPITFNGVEYDIPSFRDTNYANELTQFFVAIPNGTLQPTGGTFTLLADVDFGASYGLKSLYLKSRGASVSTAGIFRMATAESIGWRNNADDGNLLLTTNASDELLYNGSQVLTGAGPSSYVSSISGTANQVVASGSTGAVTLSLPQSLATSSALQFGSLALGASLDSSSLLSMSSTTKGFLPPRMTTVQRDAIGTPAEGLTIFNTTTGQMNLYSTGAWTALTMTAGGTVNAGLQYQLGYYAANGTAISALTAITATRALVSDANGLPVASTVTTSELQAIAGLTASRALQTGVGGLIEVSTVTTTELSYVAGVTSSIQDQINLKAPLASPTFTGTVTIPSPFTLGATSVTASGTEMNYLVGVTSGIQAQLDAKAADSLVVHLAGSETITGAKTFQSSTLLLQEAGSTDAVTIAVATLAASRVYTVPDAGGAASFVMTEGAQTINGAKSFGSAITTSAVQNTAGVDIQGTNTNDNAAVGYVGEFISSGAVANTNAAATTELDDLTSISLTAGDWDIEGAVRWDGNGATWTQCLIGISTTAGNSAVGMVNSENEFLESWASSSTTPIDKALIVPRWRLSLSATTTVYLKRSANYSAGTPRTRAYFIGARRVR